MASIDLFIPNDECSRSAEEFFNFNNSNSSVIVSLHTGDCPARLQAYATECSDQYGDEVSIIIILYVIVISYKLT